MEVMGIGSSDLHRNSLNTADLQKSAEEECLWGARQWKNVSVRNYVIHLLPFVNMHQP